MANPAPAQSASPESKPPVPHIHERAVITVRTLVTAALIVLGVVALVFLLARVLDLVLVILVAIVFAEGIRPLVRALGRRGLPEPVGIIVVYLLVLGAIAGFAALLVQPIVSEAQSLAANFPTYQKHLLDLFNSLESQFHFNVDVSKQVGDALGTAQQVLLAIGGTIFAVVVNFVLVLVIGFMWLVSSERLKHFVVDLMPPRHHALATDVFREIGFRMGGYLRAVAINSLVVGAATGLACFFLGLPSPILLGVFAGLIAIIPVVGAFVGVVPPTLLAFTISPIYPVIVLAVMLVIQLIDANTVVPVVMNRVVALPALAVVLALLIGGALAGVIGALLAVPVAAAVQVIVLRVVVPAVHQMQGRPDAAFSEYNPPPATAVGARGARGLIPRLRRP